jgi:hypothetical protein
LELQFVANRKVGDIFAAGTRVACCGHLVVILDVLAAVREMSARRWKLQRRPLPPTLVASRR